jgi:dipeptide/tripeptide permease
MVKDAAPGWSSAAYVLIFQSCLGFSFYGVTANMVLLLESYAGASESGAESLTNYFGAVVGLTPLLGGFLSDKVLGCYHTIMSGGIVFGTALVCTTVAVHFQLRALLLPTIFVLLPVGYGLLTATVNVFGAHQFAEGEDKTSWFSWFYFSINIGSILAFLIPGYIQQNVSFSVGIAVPCCVLLCGLALFASRKNHFVHPQTEVQDSEVVDTTVDTWKVWKQVLPAVLWTVLFSICYCQMCTTWYVQGLWMNRSLFGFDVPVSYMMCIDPLFVMLAITLLEGYVFPHLRSLNIMPSSLARMGMGMGFSALGMMSAFYVERLRLHSVFALDPTKPSPVSIFLQVPQFMFVAFAEVFVYTTIQEYAFSLAPNSMKSTINAVNSFAGSIANVLAGLMTTLCSSWIPPTNPNMGHYDSFYILLAGLSLVGGMGFLSLLERPKPLASLAAKTNYGMA